MLQEIEWKQDGDIWDTDMTRSLWGERRRRRHGSRAISLAIAEERNAQPHVGLRHMDGAQKGHRFTTWPCLGWERAHVRTTGDAVP
jgi:hypothetical protein